MSDAVPAPLAGATIVITRPVGDARALQRAIERLGGTALHIPGLALRATGGDAVAHAATLASAQDWIFVSPAAVRFAFRALPTLRPAASTRVFALGGGTAAALARHALQAIFPSQRHDSEGLLALDAFAAMRGRHVALVGAPGGRDLITTKLRERGADVTHVHVYERAAPRLTRLHGERLADAIDPLIVLVSSAEALAHIVAWLSPALLERLRLQTIVVSSERLDEIACRHGFAHTVRAASAAPDDLLAAAQRALAHHRL